MDSAISGPSAGGYVGMALAHNPNQDRRQRMMQQQPRAAEHAAEQAQDVERPAETALPPAADESLPPGTLFETGLIAQRLPLFLNHIETMRQNAERWEPPASDLRLTDKTI